MKVLKVIGIIIVILIIAALLFTAGVVAGVYYVMVPPGGANPVKIEVAKGASAGEIADKMEKAGVIRNALLFRVVVRMAEAGRDIKPGKYMIDPNDNMMEILHQLRKGIGKLRLVTIPEGLTLPQVAKLMEEKDVVSEEDFLNAASEKMFAVNGRTLENLEGYLLPDTYDIPARYDASRVIEVLVESFKDKVVPLYKRKKDNLPRKLSLHQVVTLASMVEREAKVPDERPIIAAVYYNRLKKGMKLECDATVQYALGKNKEVLKYSDLEVKSPYNTYLHKGLPPGPICNPGISSIKAVLEPKDVDYLYYVRNDVKDDGSHVFSKTYSEHQRAIRKYQK